jgi:hypothetical protein
MVAHPVPRVPEMEPVATQVLLEGVDRQVQSVMQHPQLAEQERMSQQMVAMVIRVT